jgi:CHAT domain-containing protein
MSVRTKLCRTAVTVGCAAGLALLLTGGAAAPPRPDEPAPPADAKAPWQRLLTGDDAKRAAEWEQKIDELCRAGHYTEAQEAARQVLALRRRVQGVEHWETADARRLLQTLEKIAALPDEARAELRELTRLDARVMQLYRQGHYADALPLLKRSLDIRRRHLGEDHPETITTLNDLAFFMSQSGQYAAAEPLFRQALALRRKVLGEDHPDTAMGYNNVAGNLRAQGKYAAAEPLFRQALAIRRKVLGENHPDTANSYNNVAANLSAQGKYAAAEPLLRQALAIFRKVHGEEAPETAALYNNLAANFDKQGKYTTAEPLGRKALAIRRKVLGENHPDTAASYNTLASTLDGQGQYVEAEPLLRQALAIRRKVLGEDHPGTAQSYHYLARNLRDQGRFAQAESFLRQALAINRQVLGEDHPQTAQSYNALAVTLADQGHYAEAEPLLRQALTIQRKGLGEEHPDTATSYNNLALNLHDQGKDVEAEPLARRALLLRRKLLGEKHPYTATSYNNLALILNAQGKLAEAEPLYRQALTIRRQAHGEDHPDTALGCGNLAAILADQGKYAEAEPLFRRAVAICRQALGENHPHTAVSCNNLAGNLYAQGKYTEAEVFHREALTICRQALGREHRYTAGCYHHLALDVNAQGKYAEAQALWREAAGSFEAARLAVSFTGLERAAFAAERSPLPHVAACLARTGKAVDAWTSWEADLARGLFDDLSGRSARPLSEAERQREQELTGKLQLHVKQLAAFNQLKDETDAHRRQREELEQQRDTALAALTRFEAELARTHGPAAGQVYELARVQAQLPADAALISWLDLKGESRAADPNGEHWACLVRRRGDPVWVRLPGSGPKGAWAEADDQLPRQVRELLVKPPSDATVKWREQTGRLHAQRLAPLAKHLAATADLPAVRHLIILPSPWLAGLPVEALVEARTDDQPAYTISYAPSGTLFAWLQEQRQEHVGKAPKPDAPRLLAVGDPAFGRPGGPAPSPPPLPGSRREVLAIARLFDHADKLLGSEASEQQLERLATSGRLRDYRYLHLATHGLLDPKNTMRSALLLAQDDLPDPRQQVLAGKQAYDGRLTAAQILRSWKLDAELVTLSACQSGLGTYQGGEGYVGFAQALFVAGARGLVLSQWPVDDNATALLMTRFYQNLLGKRAGLEGPLAKAQALEEAKAWLRGLNADQVEQRLEALSRGVPRPRPATPVPAAVHPYGHPYYWAAFILVGDPN